MLLEIATLLSGIGNGVAAIALPWLTLQLTGDPAAAGMVVAAGAVPALAASLVSGVIIDRFGQKRSSVGSDVISALSAAMIPVFALFGMLGYPLVLVASVVGATFDPLGVTAREALLPDVAEQACLRLERVNTMHEAVWGIAWLAGPGLAGFLISTVGAENSFWVMAAGFVASILSMAAMPLKRKSSRSSEKRHWIAEAIEGARFVIGEPAIRSTTIVANVSFVAAYSTVAVVLPVVFERLCKPKELGVLVMAYSMGGVIGALAYGAVAERLPRRTAYIAGLVATVAMLAVFVTPAPYWAQLLAMGFGGLLNGPVSPIFNTILQERTAKEMRGRALSMVFSFAYALLPVGYISAGFLINAIGIPWTLAVMTAVALVAAVWSVITPAMRDIEAPEIAELVQ
ncbi:MAG: MFS transporter [Coriobacteriia bacterium]|nr:MFS transporter [Coriobacteriia bacterium]